MVKKATVDRWNIPEINTSVNDNGDVVTIHCKICKEFYSDDEEGRSLLQSLNGAVKKLVNRWIEGSDIIKKNNAQDHVNRAKYHMDAVRKLKERAEEKSESLQLTEAETIAAAAQRDNQQSILTKVRELQNNQRDQLLKKFQLAHFVVLHNKSFNMYQNFVNFEKDIHKVDVGNGFLNNKSGQEITIFLSNSLLRENVVKPLNEGRRLYFSLLYDGSSSAKTNDEKELYVIKTCNKGKPQFDVLSLEQPDDTNAAGLHIALQHSFQSAKFTFNRQERQIGNGSDGASANKSLFKLEKEALGEHLVFTWCLSHKLELALKDAFRDSSLDQRAQNQLTSEFYLFKKATLKWRLFKRYAQIHGCKALR